jgi:hypothetical protein
MSNDQKIVQNEPLTENSVSILRYCDIVLIYYLFYQAGNDLEKIQKPENAYRFTMDL